jgi:hypothetical protein
MQIAGELDPIILAVLKASLHVEFQGLREYVRYG